MLECTRRNKGLLRTISLFVAFVLTADAARPGEQASRTTQITLLGSRAHLQLDQATSEQDSALGPAPAASEAWATAGSRQTNLCKNQDEVSTQKRALAKGLEGVHLTAVVPRPGNAYAIKDKDGKWSGYDFEVLKELSKRGNFTFELVGKEQRKTSSPEEKQAQFLELNKQYDLVVDHNTEKSSREKQEIFPVFNLWDSSLVLTTNRVQSTSFSHKMLLLATPYDAQVWLSFWACCLATGVLYWILERPGNSEVDKSKADQPEAEKPDADEAAETLGIAVYFSLMNCTQIIAYTPRTWPGRILMFSWSMIGVVFLAAYTANLAMILVVETGASQQWKDMDDVMRNQARICVSHTGSAIHYMNAHYPRYVHLVNTGGSVGPIKSMVEGKCDAAIVWQSTYQVATLKEEYNANCFLHSVGPKLTTTFSGWSSVADYNERCTVLVRDVLHTLFQEMSEDGSLDMHMEKLLDVEKTLKTSCSAPTTPGTSLTLKSMCGVFLLYLIGATVACVVYLLSRKEVVEQDAS